MRLIFAPLIMLVVSTSAWAELKLELMPTTPQAICDHSPHSAAWCTVDDMKPAEQAAGMVKNIVAMIERTQTPQDNIYIGYFSFSNKPIFRALCERGKMGVHIEGYFDVSYSGSDQLPSRLMSECQGPNNNNVEVYFLGEVDNAKGTWRLHHNKFLIVEPQNEDLDINFSSGNLSAFGTSLHFDHWVHVMAPAQSQLARSHQCVLQSLKSAQGRVMGGVDDPDLYLNLVRDCRSEQGLLDQEEAIQTEGVYLLTSPNDDNGVYKAFRNEVARIISAAQSGQPQDYSIRGAIQHFLHRGIATDLIRACELGVNVELMMDDDVIAGSSEVQGVGEFYRENLANTCIKFRFMETNAEVRQMMHHKFLVFTGPGYARTYSGAGHFTYAALQNNYENFYVTNNQSLADAYVELFETMKAISLTEDEVLAR